MRIGRHHINIVSAKWPTFDMRLRTMWRPTSNKYIQKKKKKLMEETGKDEIRPTAKWRFYWSTIDKLNALYCRCVMALFVSYHSKMYRVVCRKCYDQYALIDQSVVLVRWHVPCLSDDIHRKILNSLKIAIRTKRNGESKQFEQSFGALIVSVINGNTIN